MKKLMKMDRKKPKEFYVACEHNWVKIAKTGYSLCSKCGACRHDKDGHIFWNVESVERPIGSNALSRFLFMLVNPRTKKEYAIVFLIVCGYFILITWAIVILFSSNVLHQLFVLVFGSFYGAKGGEKAWSGISW